MPAPNFERLRYLLQETKEVQEWDFEPQAAEMLQFLHRPLRIARNSVACRHSHERALEGPKLMQI